MGVTVPCGDVCGVFVGEFLIRDFEYDLTGVVFVCERTGVVVRTGEATWPAVRVGVRTDDVLWMSVGGYVGGGGGGEEGDSGKGCGEWKAAVRGDEGVNGAGTDSEGEIGRDGDVVLPTVCTCASECVCVCVCVCECVCVCGGVKA